MSILKEKKLNPKKRHTINLIIDFIAIGLFSYILGLNYNPNVNFYSIAMIVLLIFFPMLRDVKGLIKTLSEERKQ